MTTSSTFAPAGVRANPAMNFLGAPRVAFSPNEDGTPTEAEKAAADKAAADKAAADKAAADKAAADRIAEAAKKGAETLALELAKAEAEKAELLKETMGRKDKIKELEANLSKFDGIDPEAVKKLLAEKSQAEKTELEKKGEYDRLLKMAGEEHEKATKSLQDRIAELEKGGQGLMTTIEDLTVGQSFATSKYIQDDLVLPAVKARQLYGAYFDIEGGKVIGYNKPRGAADRTKLVDASAQPVAFDEAFKRIIESDPDKERLVKFKGQPGGGSRTDNSANPGNKKKEEAGLHGASRILAGLRAEAKTV